MTFVLLESRWQPFARAALAGAALWGCTSAMALTVAYSGTGAVTGPAQTPPQLQGLVMSAATSDYTFGDDGSWAVDKLFSFNVATLVGGGSFSFSNGSSSLVGTFTSARANSTAPTSLVYTVSGGTGAYAGFGWGSTLGNPFGLPAAPVSFTEGGFFNVSAVPEPGSALLLAVGLGSCLLWRRKAGAR